MHQYAHFYKNSTVKSCVSAVTLNNLLMNWLKIRQYLFKVGAYKQVGALNRRWIFYLQMNIKLLILISLIVPAVIGGFWRRRRRRSHKPNRSGTVTGSIRCNGGSIRSCTGSIHGEKKWGKNTSLGGHVTCGGGGCGGGITFTHRFKRDAKVRWFVVHVFFLF